MRTRRWMILAALLALPSAAGADIRPIAGGAPCRGPARHCPMAGFALAVRDGALYVADSANNVVQRILADELTVETLAGNTLPLQVAPTPTTAALATALRAAGLGVTATGDVYLTVDRTLRRVRGPSIATITQPGGAVSMLSPVGVAVSASGVWVADPGMGRVLRFDLACDGPLCQPTRTIAGLSTPYDVAVTADESAVYVLEQGGGGRIKRLAPDGTATLIAGGGSDGGSDIPATTAALGTPTGFCLAPDGALYVPGVVSSRVARVRDGVLTIIAGTGQAQVGSAWLESSDPLQQPITRPSDCAVSDDGRTLYVSSESDRRIYAIGLPQAPSATQTPIATATASAIPTSTASATPTRTATAIPSSTATPTRTATAPPTATATIRPCGAGEAPSCVQGPG